ncbi:MAG: helix-turn-helix transcriptional regulator [Solirubrobacteraceae bacterium]|nr:helix-turn-helix transcriptional regulator [Solirubrobacteraceae bacterium]
MTPSRDTPSPLGEFLRARREQIGPEQAGLPDLGRRRVPGLRREELAMLAGVSVDYYVRLEQGRNDHPSAQVLDALARVLQLDVDSAAHLRALAEPPRPRRRSASRAAERANPVLVRALDALETQPAFVLGRYMDVLAVNPLMEALNDAFRVGNNIVRSLFLNPASHDLYPEWDKVAVETVASLRAAIGTDLDDPGFTQLVGELSVASDEFRQRWARHDVRPKSGGVKRMIHPMVGELELPYETLDLGSTPGQQLGIYSPEPGSISAERLAMLASLVADGAAR